MLFALDITQLVHHLETGILAMMIHCREIDEVGKSLVLERRQLLLDFTLLYRPRGFPAKIG